jgi:hypothetical protein
MSPASVNQRVGRGRLFAAVAATATAFATAVAVTATTAAAITPVAAATATATPAAAATTATATVAAATTTTTTAKAATTRRALFARTRDIDCQGAALDLVAVELLHALLGFVTARHRHEGESTGTTGEFVEDDLDDADGSDLAEEGLEVLGGAGEGKVPHVELVVF